MSVLIKGMEIPQSCDDCKLRNGIGKGDGKVIYHCAPLEKWVMPNPLGKTDLTTDCPLVPVPPHGLSDDVRSVVRGKWKHGVCQICFFDWSEVAPFASVPNYCPNCGAHMREEN